MRLLILTQKVDKNDHILGFFYQWIIEFSKYFESIIVVCLYEGEHNLPENVRVLSLGKERGVSRLGYIINFYRHIVRERRNYDQVFVHMNQVYVVLGGMLWRIWGKRISLWYTHRAVGIMLRIATLYAHDIFTSARESFNVRGLGGGELKKLHVVGHGINIEQFLRKGGRVRDGDSRFSLISIGRITRIKNLDTMIEAARILKDKGYNFEYEIIGPQVTADDGVYYSELQRMLVEKKLEDDVIFRNAVPYSRIQEYLWKSDVNLNLTPTGGIDKVVIEGIVAGVMPLVSNMAFTNLFGAYSRELTFKLRDPDDLADKIEKIYNMRNKSVILDSLLNKIRIDYSIPEVVRRIVGQMGIAV